MAPRSFGAPDLSRQLGLRGDEAERRPLVACGDFHGPRVLSFDRSVKNPAAAPEEVILDKAAQDFVTVLERTPGDQSAQIPTPFSRATRSISR